MNKMFQRGLAATLALGLVLGIVSFAPVKLHVSSSFISEEAAKTLTDPKPWANAISPMTDPKPWGNEFIPMTDPKPWAGVVTTLTDPKPW